MPALDQRTDIPSSLDVRVRGVFNNIGPEGLRRKLDDFMSKTGLHDEYRYFEKGMFLAQQPEAFTGDREDGLRLEPDEKEMLEYDDVPVKRLPISSLESNSHSLPKSKRSWKIDFTKWHIPYPLWKLTVLCSIGAAVQGWDEAAVNGAQTWYQPAFNIYITSTGGVEPRPLIVGLVNSAPYLCSVVSCWFTPFLNARLGRRGTIFFSAFFSAVFALAQAFAQNWQTLFAFRLLMGLGIGPKSATVPIYAAESAPDNIRGSLVMLWQVFTAVGIMCGCISGVAFKNLGQINNGAVCPQPPGPYNATQLAESVSYRCSQNWRFILASPMVAPIILCLYIYTQPESPRWSIAKGHDFRHNQMPNSAQKCYKEAWKALEKLRHTKLQAARDMFSIYHELERERTEVHARRDNPKTSWYRRGVFELFSGRRNRRATIASLVCMFAQQFCGVNAIIYYSNYILQRALRKQNDSQQHILTVTLLYTMGFGIINWFFAIFAFYTIDSVGRRSLLLLTFPFLALFHVWIAIAFALENVWQNSYKLALAGMYLFGIAYSPGEGPVPFVYAAESLPLYNRDRGMGLVTSVNWLFNWLIAFTFTEFTHTFYLTGTFFWYAGWCVILWFMIFFLVPETRQLNLEQLDMVFQQSSSHFFRASLNKAKYNIGMSSTKPLPVYAMEMNRIAPSERRRSSDSETINSTSARPRLPSQLTRSDAGRGVEQDSISH